MNPTDEIRTVTRKNIAPLLHGDVNAAPRPINRRRSQHERMPRTAQHRSFGRRPQPFPDRLRGYRRPLIHNPGASVHARGGQIYNPGRPAFHHFQQLPVSLPRQGRHGVQNDTTRKSDPPQRILPSGSSEINIGTADPKHLYASGPQPFGDPAAREPAAQNQYVFKHPPRSPGARTNR